MKKNIFDLKGGLGNQLFIYFAAAQHAIKQNARTIYFNTSGFENAGTRRKLELTKFDLPVTYEITKINRFVGLHDYFFRAMKFVPSISNALGFKYVEEIGFDDEFLDKKFHRISGYFQSWKYFMEIKESFPSFKLHQKQLSNWAKRTIEDIKKVDPILCHIRTGDYLKLYKEFGILSLDYYREALDLLRSREVNGPVWIITESPESLPSNFSRILDAKILFKPSGISDVDIFSCMQSFRHSVISNSTFAWWAAFSGESKNTVAPKDWFRSMSNPIDLIPPNWHCVDSSWQ